MKKQSRTLSLVLILMMLLTSTTCAVAEEDAGKSWQKDTSPIDLTLYMNASWWNQMWDPPIAEMMTKECGVNLKIMTPVADDNQQLVNMINSGDIPDIIITEIGNPCNDLLIEGDMVWDIDTLVDTYAPELRETADPAVFTDFKWEDGKTYFWTNFTDSDQYAEVQKDYNKLVTSNQVSICIRKDYWEEIGSPDMSTPEKFINAIKQIKALHPDKIGYYQGDGSMSNTGNTYLGALGNYLGITSYYRDSEGNIKLWPRTEEFKDAVLFYNELAREGLLTRDSFIDDSTVARSRVLNGELISYGWTLYDCTQHVPADNPDTEYIVIDPWDSYRAVRTGGGWQTAFITKGPNAERAIQFVNYMLDPDYYTQFGIRGEKNDAYVSDAEGPHYYMDEEGWPHYTADYMAKQNNGEADRATSGSGAYFFFNSSALANILYWEKGTDPLYDHFNEVFAPHVEYIYEFNSRVIKPAADSDEAMILSKYSSTFNSHLVDIVFAESEEAAIAALETMNNAMDDMGCKDLEAYYTNAVNEYLSR